MNIDLNLHRVQGLKLSRINLGGANNETKWRYLTIKTRGETYEITLFPYNNDIENVAIKDIEPVSFEEEFIVTEEGE